jgi:hypothetical protein
VHRLRPGRRLGVGRFEIVDALGVRRGLGDEVTHAERQICTVPSVQLVVYGAIGAWPQDAHVYPTTSPSRASARKDVNYEVGLE